MEMEKIKSMFTDNLRYAGFGPRLASAVLDFIVWLPLILLENWGVRHWRLFTVYSFIPFIILGLIYYVYLVRRFGGTPGKLMVGIRISRLDGSPIGYREAFKRYFPDFIFGILIPLSLMAPLFHMTDAEYHSLTFLERSKHLIESAPPWYKPLSWIQSIWVWSELIVLLTNKKRRALHDFIAGTVVVYKQPDQTPSPSPDARQVQDR